MGAELVFCVPSTTDDDDGDEDETWSDGLFHHNQLMMRSFVSSFPGLERTKSSDVEGKLNWSEYT